MGDVSRETSPTHVLSLSGLATYLAEASSLAATFSSSSSECLPSAHPIKYNRCASRLGLVFAVRLWKEKIRKTLKILTTREFDDDLTLALTLRDRHAGVPGVCEDLAHMFTKWRGNLHPLHRVMRRALD